MKKTKNDLKRDTVTSSTFHVGIEIELRVPCDDDNGRGEHDCSACDDSQREMLYNDGAVEIMQNYLGLSREDARHLENWFNLDGWIDNYMSEWTCDDSECPYRSRGTDDVRDEMRGDLVRLTGNKSFKVVEDSSIDTDYSNTDAEVCWNYFASRDTIADNEKIMNYLREKECDFDTSCGLHINLNNYLNVPTGTVPTTKLDFLFNFVAKSRRTSSFCNRFGVSHDAKYSMIYNQGDRLEFRFFSPTLCAEKLNHYVILANTVYKRLAGQNAKLPKKSMTYFLEKMTKVNGLSFEIAAESLKQVNSIKPMVAYTFESEAA